MLAKLADASDVGAALDGYNPPQPEFKALKAKLAELRKGALAPRPRKKRSRDRCMSAKARSLRPGMKDQRVAGAAQAPQHCQRQEQPAL